MSRKNKSKSCFQRNMLLESAHLVNRLSEEMQKKYNNVFTVLDYKESQLKNDISRIVLNHRYSSNPSFPREGINFHSVESMILNIVRGKKINYSNSQKKIQIPMKIKLPSIPKSSKPKILLSNNNNNNNNDNNIKIIKEEEINQKEKDNEIIQNEALNNPKEEIINENINNKTNNNNGESNNNKLNINDNNTSNNIMVENFLKDLTDKEKSRLIRDWERHKIDEENKKIEQILAEVTRQEKIQSQLKYMNDLQLQIEEKERLKQKQKLLDLKEYGEVQKQIIKEMKEEERSKINDLAKKMIERKQMEEEIKEKLAQKKRRQINNEVQNKYLTKKAFDSLTNEQKLYLEYKAKLEKEVEKYQNIIDHLQRVQNEKEQLKENENEKINNNNSKNNHFPDNYYFTNESIENKKILEKVKKRQKEQEIVGTHLKKVYNSINEEYESDKKYLIESEKKKKLRQLECELADKKREVQVEQMKKLLDMSINNRNIRTEKIKNDDIKIRQILDQDYDKYLKEEEEKKQKENEKKEQYRKELEAQIELKKQKQLEGGEERSAKNEVFKFNFGD